MAAFDALPFCPETWSNDPVCKTYGNCYAYALGDGNLGLIQAGLYPVPGSLSGHEFIHHRDPAAFKRMLVENSMADGLIHTGGKIELQANTYPVALLSFTKFGRASDFHRFRMNPDSSWGHKFYERPPEPVVVGGKAVEVIDNNFLYSSGSRDYHLVCFFNVPRDLSMRVSGDALNRAVQSNVLLEYVADNNVRAASLARIMEPKRIALQAQRSRGAVQIPVA